MMASCEYERATASGLAQFQNDMAGCPSTQALVLVLGLQLQLASCKLLASGPNVEGHGMGRKEVNPNSKHASSCRTRPV